MKYKCEDCLKSFKKKELEEIALTQEKLCKECYKKRISYYQSEHPYPMP